MTLLKTSGLALLTGGAMLLSSPKTSTSELGALTSNITVCMTPKGCVFKTLFGEETDPFSSGFIVPEEAKGSIDKGLTWISQAQHPNGGWGAGSHRRQDVLDPHAVPADPATTSMVAMALLRTRNTLSEGEFSHHLNKALNFILTTVESTPVSQIKITDLSGTQIQTKLGDNIDAALTAQFLANMLDKIEEDNPLKERVEKALKTCVNKIQRAQDLDGSIKGSGWAGVLQSSLATTALEAADHQGIEVDEDVLEKAREYQKGNYNAETGDVKTDKGAGIVLYSVSGSVRSSAKAARKVKAEMKKAKETGTLAPEEEVSVENLMEIGYTRDEAVKYNTSYQVYESSKNKAQEDGVMSGFGNNGGEEFLSYLQTGESLIINQDEEWEKWYANTANRLISIQNNDGSWNGHHCITSPVFCTATTLLTLSIHNDIERFVKLGED
ncbi:MAG: prenyltransferase/squalene oxidase repeat-containing protein [Bacteroidota bacterium]